MSNPTPAPPAATVAAPSGHDPMAQTLALIQPWIDYVPPQQRRLGLFVFIAFLAHVTAFFFISIDTTRAELRHQLRPHVTVDSLQSTSLSGQSLGDSFWDQLNDPRVFLLPQDSAGASGDKPKLDFMSITSSSGNSDLPPSAPPLGFQFVRPINPPLDQRVGDSMDPPRQHFNYNEPAPDIAPNTQWQWDGNLASRQPSSLPDLPEPISDTDLNPTQIRISVNPNGGVEHVMVEQSSGKADLDQQAAMAAQKIRFRAVDQTGSLWGRLTVFWHYSAKPREEVVPTPPAGQ